MGQEEDRDELLAKHRKELKELRGKIQAIKNAAPKGDKKRKKQAADEVTQLEGDTARRHAAELSELAIASHREVAEPSAASATCDATSSAAAACDDDEAAAGAGDPATDGAGSKLTKAQRRKLKKEQEAREREQRLAEADKAAVNSDRSVELRTITSLLSSLSLKVHQVEADGNCLYHALAYQLHNRKSESDMLALRRQAANFMLRHREDFEAFVTDSEAAAGDAVPSEDSFERYCRSVAETTMWGGQLEIQALSRALDRKIVVYQAGTDSITIGDDTACPPLSLVYHRHDLGTGEHYNAAVTSVS